MTRRSAVVLLLTLSAFGPAGPLAAGTSNLASPAVVFATPGPKLVTLQVCNSSGCNTIQKTVNVSNPLPAVVSAVVSPLTVETGQLVRLTGSGSGPGALSYTWRVLLGTSPVASLPGASTWWDTRGVAPGAYLVGLRVANSAGFVDSVPATVLVLPETPASFFTLSPCRILDTRTASALASGLAPRMIDVAAASCGIPASARAISANVTVTGATGAGFVTLYPGNYPKPVASTINFSADQTRGNNTILSLASDGSATLASEATVAGTGTVHLIVDVNGYFF
jgi:hypothetical protein